MAKAKQWFLVETTKNMQHEIQTQKLSKVDQKVFDTIHKQNDYHAMVVYQKFWVNKYFKTDDGEAQGRYFGIMLSADGDYEKTVAGNLSTAKFDAHAVSENTQVQ